jgi:hypothetical protein
MPSHTMASGDLLSRRGLSACGVRLLRGLTVGNSPDGPSNGHIRWGPNSSFVPLGRTVRKL